MTGKRLAIWAIGVPLLMVSMATLSFEQFGAQDAALATVATMGAAR